MDFLMLIFPFLVLLLSIPLIIKAKKIRKYQKYLKDVAESLASINKIFMVWVVYDPFLFIYFMYFCKQRLNLDDDSLNNLNLMIKMANKVYEGNLDRDIERESREMIH